MSQSAIKIGRQFVMPSSQEIAAVSPREHICLSIFGRCGALFLHSLFDGHPSLTTAPGVAPYKLLAIYTESLNGREVMSRQALAAKAAYLFCDAFNQPYLRADAGLDRLGPQGDAVAEINQEAFEKHLASVLAVAPDLSIQSFSEAIHYAFDKALDMPVREKIFLHLHTVLPAQSEAILNGLVHRHVIFLVREPLDNVESIAVHLLSDPDRKRNRLSKFYSMVGGMMLFQRGQPFLRDKAVAVKLEDLKRHKETFLRKLCEEIDLGFDESLMSSTVLGLQYHSAPTQRNPGMSGFTAPSSQPQGYRLSAKDRQIFAALFDPISSFMDYPRGSGMTMDEAVLYLDRNVLDVEVAFAQMAGISPQDFGLQADVRNFREVLKHLVQERTNGLECRRLLFPA